jgi:membrane associated rhomboid family serine protease
MTILVAGTVLVFLLDEFSNYAASNLLYFSRTAILHGQIWRLITFVFVPVSSNLLQVVISLYFYWWIGSSLEREWGTARFSFFYLLGVLFNIVFGLIAGYASATYLNLSLFFAFATLYPDLRVLLFFFIPIKMKWLAIVDGVIFGLSILFSLIRLDIVGALLPIIAILNYLIFFWSDLTEIAGYRKQRFQHQHSQQTVNFKKAASKAYQEKGYIHKCAVCGKTDTEYPDMEFRYCSKCNGYYCYCMDHINNHVHIQ